ncbi:hypothetical protein ACA910_012732 [Epithemia clementina (nom. ined.)]
MIAGDLGLSRFLVEAGIWDALILQLKFAVNRHGTSYQEVEEICGVLNMLMTSCSLETQQQSVLFDDDTMDLLLRSCQWSEGARFSVVSLWYVASATAKGSRSILRNRRILLCLSDFFHQCVQEQEGGQLGNAFGILKNATFFVNDAWEFLSEIPGIVSSLLRVSSCVAAAPPKDSERLSAIWRNIAVVQDNRRRLAQNAGFLNALHSLAVCRSYDGNEGFTTTRNVLSTILSLAMDGEACFTLLMHGDGIFPAMIHGLLDCPDETIRKRASRIVRLWASHESSGALLVRCHTLLDRVSSAAIQDQCEEVRREAAEAFGRCAGLRWPMPQQKAVLDALASLCCSSSSGVIARSLKGQAAHASNRVLLMERPIFLESLIAIASDHSSPSLAREDACCALADLATEKRNRQQMASTELLDALVANMNAPNRRDHAVRALVHLAEEEANIPQMAHFPSLLQSLIQYAATAENAIKGSVKHAILLLVTEI